MDADWTQATFLPTQSTARYYDVIASVTKIDGDVHTMTLPGFLIGWHATCSHPVANREHIVLTKELLSIGVCVRECSL
jgi:hypothetical protein